jgi:hypothetical protein
MPRTLMPTPEEGDPPGARAPATNLDLEDKAVLDFLRGEYAPTAAINGAGRSAPSDGLALAADDSLLSYLPVASSCFALIQYDPTTARLVRRVIGMFGDIQDAERYGLENGYRLYDLVPATAVIARPPTSS